MYRKISAIVALTAVLSASASFDKFDTPAAMNISAQQAAEAPASRSGDYKFVPGTPEPGSRFNYIVTFDSEADIALAEDYRIVTRAGNMAIISLTADEAVALSALPEVQRISLGYESAPLLNVARKTTGVDDIHSGTNLPQAYTGKGVIVGMMDTGFEPNHINFLDADGNQRINILWKITGDATETKKGAAIKNETTDDSRETHATHVMGILAGSHKGRCDRLASFNRLGAASITKGKNIYYGVATEAEIAPAIGTFGGSNLETAVGLFREYIKEQKKPGVFNFSLGHNVGPHDGTTASNKFIAEAGKDMIICISAGNEGQAPVSLHKDFTSTSKSVSTIVGRGGSLQGILDIWSADNTPVSLKLQFVDKTGKIVHTRDIIENKTITGSHFSSNPTYIIDSQFDTYATKESYMMTNGKVDTANKRYNIAVSFVFHKLAADIYPAIVVEGQPGKSVDLYTNEGIGMYNRGFAGFTAGNSDQSINDLACGDNVIVVGAYNNAVSYCTFDGSYGSKNVRQGDIASFSSWGKTFDGRQLPTIVGPGMNMISSYSTYYYSRLDSDSQKLGSAEVTNGKLKDYWMTMSGTSMSSPFVAGVMALWLEADPALTVDKAKAIMAKTAVNDEFTAVNTQKWGYGKIDALAGIKEIVKGSVVGVSTDNKVVINQIGNGVFDIYVPGASAVHVALYNMSGSAVALVDGGENTTLDASAAPGIYLLRVNAGNVTETRKVVIK